MLSLQEVKAFVRNVLISSNQPLAIGELERDFYKLLGKKLPFRQFGFNSAGAFLHSMPDTVCFIGSRQSLVTAVVNPSQQHIKDLVSKNRLCDRNARSKWRKPQHPRRLTLDGINEENISPHTPVPEPKLKEIKLRRSLPAPSKVASHSDGNLSDEEVMNIKPTCSIFYMEVPCKMEVVRWGEEIPAASLRTETLNGCVFRVYLAEIHNPYRFWFQFVDECAALQRLMAKMNERYADMDPEELKMRLHHLVPGHYCVALYNGEWHRAQVVGQHDRETKEVLVHFLDYGTTCLVLVEEVKFLLREFSHLPQCAHRGLLADVFPDSCWWSLEATLDLFASLDENLSLGARCLRLDREQRVYALTLEDDKKNPQEVRNLSRFLVDLGYATWRADDPKYKDRPHQAECFPTFEALERGWFPNLRGVIRRYNEGEDLKMIYFDLSKWRADEEKIRKLREQRKTGSKVEPKAVELQTEMKKSQLDRIMALMRRSYEIASASKAKLLPWERKRYSKVTFLVERIIRRLNAEGGGESDS